MKPEREQAEVGSVYWMEASKRRQALEWLKRSDLSAEERRTLERFAANYRTGVGLGRDERRWLLETFARLGRRLRATSPAVTRRDHP